MKRLLITLALMTATMAMATAQNELYTPHQFQYKDFVLPYRMMLPKNFDPAKTYPIIIFLHGAGERGNDNQKQLVHGSSFFASEKHRNDFPAIVVFPQCPENIYWASVDFIWQDNGSRIFDFQPQRQPTEPLAAVMQLIDSLAKLSYTDPSRIYVGGLSMGGMGTFELLYRMPDTFAAAFPVCGGGKPSTAATWANKVPAWIFHGAIDGVVPVDLSIQMYQAARAAGAHPGLTIYPNVNHNAWDYVFLETQLIPWLFSHKK